MKQLMINSVKSVAAALWLLMIAPFVIPAFAITRLLGGDPFSMDDMGTSWMVMIFIAIGLAATTAAFLIGYWL